MRLSSNFAQVKASSIRPRSSRVSNELVTRAKLNAHLAFAQLMSAPTPPSPVDYSALDVGKFLYGLLAIRVGKQVSLTAIAVHAWRGVAVPTSIISDT